MNMTPDHFTGVVEQMAEHCVDAYRSGNTPLIFIDTHELELVIQVVLAADRSKNFVSLKEKSTHSAALAPFYHYLDPDAKNLENVENLSFGTEKLTHFPKNAKGKPYQLPHLFIVHVEKQSAMIKTGNDCVKTLRNYVQRYIHNKFKPYSVIRSSCVLLYGDIDMLDDDLKCVTEIVTEPYPGRLEIASMLRESLNSSSQLHEQDIERFQQSEDFDHIVANMTGLKYMQVQRLINAFLLPGKNQLPQLFDPRKRSMLILQEKGKILLLHNNMLELIPPKESMIRPIGMERFDKWITLNKDRLIHPREYAEARGVQPLKGILLCGVPGCGKSQAARWLGHTLDLYMVKLNMDRLMGGLLGQSEENLNTALSMTEAMAPCLLWVDEIDKVITDSSSSRKQDPTSSRMLSRLLQFMQSNNGGCLIVATANDISRLPSEMVRKDRFDALWSVFLPTQKQCQQMFQEHMEKAEKDRAAEAESNGRQISPWIFSREGTDNCFSKENLSLITECFAIRKKFLTGADIATIVREALVRLSDADFDEEIPASKWLSVIKDIADETITDVTRPDSLNNVAANYIRLLRGSFLPASKDLLFDPAKYTVTSENKTGGTILASYTGEAPASNAIYDRALFDTINTLLQRYATPYERQLSSNIFF